MSDLISRKTAIDAVHKSIFDFFDICDDDEESPMTYRDEQLLEINKAITTRIKALPSAQPERATGKWMHDKDDELFSGYCSCCGWESVICETDVADMPYCPNCGADMRGD